MDDDNAFTRRRRNERSRFAPITIDHRHFLGEERRHGTDQCSHLQQLKPSIGHFAIGNPTIQRRRVRGFRADGESGA